MIDLEPLGDRVLLKRIDEDAEMQHGLHVPEIAQVKSSKGRVIAVGEGRLVGDKIVPLPLEPGDIVLFSKYGAVEINLDGEELLVLRYDEIYFRQKLVALASFPGERCIDHPDAHPDWKKQ
jgi:chaperonin GroES